MSTFQYTFQKILDMKKKNREQVEFRYAELAQNLRIEKEESNKLAGYKSSICDGILDKQVTGTLVSEINQYQSYLQYLEQLIANHIENIDKIQQSIDQKHKELINVKIEEKKWLNLREKRLQEFNIEKNRIEQRELDEIASRRIKRGVNNVTSNG